MTARVYKNLITQPLSSLLGLVVYFGSAQVSTAASGDPWIEGAKKEGEVILYASMNLVACVHRSILLVRNPNIWVEVERIVLFQGVLQCCIQIDPG